MNDAAAAPNSAPDDSLSGVPNIGPARRAALEAAGVTTRFGLAQASVDQLVGMTGMARSLAEKTLDWVRQAVTYVAASAGATDETLAPLAPADEAAEERAFVSRDAPAEPELGTDLDEPDTDEADPLPLAEAVAPSETPASLANATAALPFPDELPPVTTPDDGDANVDVQTLLERQVLRAQTALSDLTRLVGERAGKDFEKQAERMAALLDSLPGRPGAIKSKRVRRLAAEVDATASQIEMLAQNEAKTGKKAQRAYAAILRDDRKLLEALFTAPPKPKPAEVKPPANKPAAKPDKAVKPDAAAKARDKDSGKNKGGKNNR